MEPMFLMSALQSFASALNSGDDCRCRCGGCCCDQLRDQSQQLAQYLTNPDSPFTDLGDTNHPAYHR